MPHILEATKTNARDAALVAVGMPVVLFDRVSDQLNTRIALDSYVGLARERAEHALDGYSTHAHAVTRHMRTALRPALWCGNKVAERILPAKPEQAPHIEPGAPPAETIAAAAPSRPAKKVTAKKATRKAAKPR